MLQSTNPATGQMQSQHPSLTELELQQAIAAGQHAQVAWKALSYSERGEYLIAIAKRLQNDGGELAKLMALEMGKPVKEGIAEVAKGASCAEYYAAHAEKHLAAEELPSDAEHSYVCYPPLGMVLGILPWNAPVWLAFRFLAPALMAGNVCLMKHDPNVPACAEALAKIMTDILPQDVFVHLPLENDLVETAISHPAVSAVSFTGSSRTGSLVAKTAAAHIKPAVLELGGSDPLIVLADADLDKAADVATLSRIINAGQSCIAAKRILVEESVYDDMVDKLHERLARLRLGDPLDETTDIGPIARADLRENLHRQVTETTKQGARCLLGGELPSGDGFYYPATLLVDARESMCAMHEETFGPVMVVAKVKDAEHALLVANNTDYGLGAAVWTRDKQIAQHFIAHLQAGQVAVNGIVKTDPRLPSGGIKQSGYGRELGPHGIREFVNVKQVWVGKV